MSWGWNPASVHKKLTWPKDSWYFQYHTSLKAKKKATAWDIFSPVFQPFQVIFCNWERKILPFNFLLIMQMPPRCLNVEHQVPQTARQWHRSRLHGAGDLAGTIQSCDTEVCLEVFLFYGNQLVVLCSPSPVLYISFCWNEELCKKENFQAKPFNPGLAFLRGYCFQLSLLVIFWSQFVL